MDPLEALCKVLLAEKREQVAKATGDTQGDYKYGQADSVRTSRIAGFVFVVFRGKEYGPARATFGALDGDKNKSTVLVQVDEKWWKLWFFDKDVK